MKEVMKQIETKWNNKLKYITNEIETNKQKSRENILKLEEDIIYHNKERTEQTEEYSRR